MESPPFPVETLRHWYVTPFGGHSDELSFYQIGLRAAAIHANTELVPAVDRVRVGLLGRRNVRPFLLDHPFEVVALDAARPEALAKSPNGEAVLPEGDAVVRHPFPEPQPGDVVLINGVAAKRLSDDPEKLAEVLAELFREEHRRGLAS